MSDFKAKMQQNNIEDRLPSLQRSPDSLAVFEGPTSREVGRGSKGGRNGKEEGG